MLANLTFAAIGLGMAFAWLEMPGMALLAMGAAIIANLVDMHRQIR